MLPFFLDVEEREFGLVPFEVDATFGLEAVVETVTGDLSFSTYWGQGLLHLPPGGSHGAWGWWALGHFALITWRPSRSRPVFINVLPSIEVYEMVLVSQPALTCMFNVQKGGKGKDR